MGKRPRKALLPKIKPVPEGCGGEITWDFMEPVRYDEFSEDAKDRKTPYTGDLKQLPEPAMKNFDTEYNKMLSSLGALGTR